MFIAIPNHLAKNTEELSSTLSRIQAVLVKIGKTRLLLINVYFPTDPKLKDFDTDELLSTIEEINKIIQRNTFTDIIIAGDFNCDFKRKTKFVDEIENFVDESDLLKSWDNFEVDFTHAIENNGKTFISTIDHFFWNKNIANKVQDSGVIHLVHNLSDHSPIYCSLKVNFENTPNVEEKQNIRTQKPDWKIASDQEKEQFFENIDTKLKNINIPAAVVCNDVKCQCDMHKTLIDDFLFDILVAFESSAKDYLPQTSQSNPLKKPTIPRWKEDIEPLRDDALFWNSVWISAGKPMNTSLHAIQKHTRNKYHLQIRRNKRMLDKIKQNKLLEQCLNGTNGFFSEIKSMRKCSRSTPDVMDGQSDGIPQLFAKKYEELYNSVDDKENLDRLREDIEKNVQSKDSYEVEKITGDVVKEASKRLKKNKADPSAPISSNYFINAPDQVYNTLATLFRSYLTHGYISDILTLSTMIPLIKDKLGNQSDSGNYRSIAISSVLLKLFDWVLLLV